MSRVPSRWGTGGPSSSCRRKRDRHGSDRGAAASSSRNARRWRSAEGQPALAEVVRTRLRVSGVHDQAARLVSAFLSMAHSLSANDFRTVSGGRRSSPSKRIDVACSQMLRDETRALLRHRANDRSLRWYWDHVHALSHMTLLATSAEPTAWLLDMAKSFEWHTWTPSFPLVRERMFRLALRGAWVAARFGPHLVDRYLRAIHERRTPSARSMPFWASRPWPSRRPGTRPPSSDGLVGALGRRLAHPTDENDRLVSEACERSVELVVSHPKLAERMTMKRGRTRSSALASRVDPRLRGSHSFSRSTTSATAAKSMRMASCPRILALPTVVPAPACRLSCDIGSREDGGGQVDGRARPRGPRKDGRRHADAAVGSPFVSDAALSCRDVAALVTDELEGALSEATRRRFEEHMSGCEGCRTLPGRINKPSPSCARFPRGGACT